MYVPLRRMADRVRPAYRASLFGFLTAAMLVPFSTLPLLGSFMTRRVGGRGSWWRHSDVPCIYLRYEHLINPATRGRRLINPKP